MRADLARFLARGTVTARERQVWGGTTPLAVASYLCADLPPLAYVTSVRAVVFRGDAVLATREGKTWHVLPGGRREGDEAPTATLEREILEESGWTLADATLLGCLHLRHLTPRQPDYPWPHPDFLQPVYLARAANFRPEALLPNAYEPDPYTFRPIAEMVARAMPMVERALLQAALARRDGT